MKSVALITLGFICWTVLVAWISGKAGFQRGFRKWKADATRAYELGRLDGRREERVDWGGGR
jgi:hypothetical protein